ncbi:MAG: ferredoxin, partial [Spirochaetia bacterium]|nr:ferredoxin [Spirochaetia bacterium]
CRDIERAYQRNGNTPCPNCYASKTLIIESILQGLTNIRANKTNAPIMNRPRIAPTAEDSLDEQAILQELSLNTCQCMHMSELVQIVETALTFRRRKRVRRN